MKNLSKLTIIFCSLLLACSKTSTVTPTTSSSENSLLTIDFKTTSNFTTSRKSEEANKFYASFPSGTDLTKITVTIAVSPNATVSPASGSTQDFTNDVVFTVTAQNGNKQSYTVSVSNQNLLLYNATTGASKVVDTKNFATISSPAIASGWSDVLNIGHSVLFYDTNTGKATATDNKKFTKISDYTIEPKLDNIVYFSGTKYVFCRYQYGGSNDGFVKDKTTLSTQDKFVGESANFTSSIATPEGYNLSYDKKTGNTFMGAILPFSAVTPNLGNVGAGFTSLTSIDHGNLLFYNSVTGASAIYNALKPFAKVKELTISTGWTNVVNIDGSQILFYNSKTGESMITDNQNFTKTSVTFPNTAGWTHLITL